MINNAGIFIAKPFTDFTEEDYDAITDVNLPASSSIPRGGRPAMLEQARRSPRQISTTPGRPAQPKVPSVLASLTKGGLNAATSALAIEYATRGIRANAVASETSRPPCTSVQYDALAQLHPVGRMGEISDIVDGVLYLENAPFVTGAILHVDGGQNAGH